MLVEEGAAAMVRLLPLATAQDIANTLWACDDLGWHQASVFVPLLAQFAGLIHQVTPVREISSALLPCARTRHQGPALRAVVEAALCHSDTLAWDSQALANTLFAWIVFRSASTAAPARQWSAYNGLAESLLQCLGHHPQLSTEVELNQVYLSYILAVEMGLPAAQHLGEEFLTAMAESNAAHVHGIDDKLHSKSWAGALTQACHAAWPGCTVTAPGVMGEEPVSAVLESPTAGPHPATVAVVVASPSLLMRHPAGALTGPAVRIVSRVRPACDAVVVVRYDDRPEAATNPDLAPATFAASAVALVRQSVEAVDIGRQAGAEEGHSRAGIRSDGSASEPLPLVFGAPELSDGLPDSAEDASILSLLCTCICQPPATFMQIDGDGDGIEDNHKGF